MRERAPLSLPLSATHSRSPMLTLSTYAESLPSPDTIPSRYGERSTKNLNGNKVDREEPFLFLKKVFPFQYLRRWLK